jgi:hypothetical protein
MPKLFRPWILRTSRLKGGKVPSFPLNITQPTKSVAREEIVELWAHTKHHANNAKIAGYPSIANQREHVHQANVEHEGVTGIVVNVLVNGHHAGQIQQL